MVELGLEPPAGHPLVSLVDRPDLRRPFSQFTSALWPEYLNNDPVAHRLRHHLPADFAAFQLALLDQAGAIVAIQRAAPIAWDGTDDGLPFDPWMRLHARLGARLARPEPRSMVITADAATWERWTGMAFPESGDYWIPGGTALLAIDLERDLGTHLDENAWMIHDHGWGPHLPCAARARYPRRHGEVAERSIAAVLKTADREVRGFESHPLRQAGPPRASWLGSGRQGGPRHRG